MAVKDPTALQDGLVASVLTGGGVTGLANSLLAELNVLVAIGSVIALVIGIYIGFIRIRLLRIRLRQARREERK